MTVVVTAAVALALLLLGGAGMCELAFQAHRIDELERRIDACEVPEYVPTEWKETA